MGENGLVRCAAAPMPSLSSPYAGSVQPVSMMMGMRAVAGCPRRRAMAVYPSIFGIITSATMSSGLVPRGQIDELQPIAGREGLEAHFHERVADQLAAPRPRRRRRAPGAGVIRPA